MFTNGNGRGNGHSNGHGAAAQAVGVATRTASGPGAVTTEQAVDLATRTPTMLRRTLELTTHHALEVFDVTGHCRDLLADSGVRDGHLSVFTPHTTCAVKINENEACFHDDLRLFMQELVPPDAYYRHDDFEVRDPATLATTAEEEPINGHSHIKQMLLGSSSEIIPVIDGVLGLGQWQRVLFLELDQARPRRVRLQVEGWR